MKLILIILIFNFLFASNANAYLDPGTFSIIINFFIALIAGVSTYILLFWNKIKSFFIKKKNDNDNDKKI